MLIVLAILGAAVPARAGVIYGEFADDGPVFWGFDREDNDILVEVQEGEMGSQEFVFTDRSGAPILCSYLYGRSTGFDVCPGDTFGFRGCRRTSLANEVVCVYPYAPSLILLHLGSGDDRMQVGGVGAHRVHAYGGPGDDVLDGGPNADVLQGEDGFDTLVGADGGDTLRGGLHDDWLDGGAGPDDLSGGAGKDTLSYAHRLRRVHVSLDDHANDGDVGGPEPEDSERDNARADIEVLLGGGADDYLNGSVRENELHGGGGHDRLWGGPGTTPDLLDGGPGDDSAYYGDRREPVVVDLRFAGGDGRPGENDDVRAVEIVTSGSSSDVLTGDSSNNSLMGGPGDDRISGGGGRDFLFGQEGDDRLSGVEEPAALDQLTCGAGDDNAVGGASDLNSRDCENTDVFTAPPTVVRAPGASVWASPRTAAVILGCDSLAPCVGQAVLLAAPGTASGIASATRRERVALARGRFAVKPGGRTRARLALTRAGRSFVARRRRSGAQAAARRRAFRAVLELLGSDRAGHRDRRRERVRVRLGRPPRLKLPPLFDPLPPPLRQEILPDVVSVPDLVPPDPAPCIEDASEDNDSSLQTTALPGSGEVAGRVCPGDPDFFEVVVPDGQTFTATAKPDPGTDLRVDLYAGPTLADLVAAGSSGGPGEPETASHKNSTGGTLKLYVRVVGDDGGYSLTTTLG